MSRKPHHVTWVVYSSMRHVDVACRLVELAREEFGAPTEAHGVDLEKIEKKLATALDERNAAVQESHALRCRLEAVEVALRQTPVELVRSPAKGKKGKRRGR